MISKAFVKVSGSLRRMARSVSSFVFILFFPFFWRLPWHYYTTAKKSPQYPNLSKIKDKSVSKQDEFVNGSVKNVE